MTRTTRCDSIVSNFGCCDEEEEEEEDGDTSIFFTAGNGEVANLIICRCSTVHCCNIFAIVFGFCEVLTP